MITPSRPAPAACGRCVTVPSARVRGHGCGVWEKSSLDLYTVRPYATARDRQWGLGQTQISSKFEQAVSKKRIDHDRLRVLVLFACSRASRHVRWT